MTSVETHSYHSYGPQLSILCADLRKHGRKTRRLQEFLLHTRVIYDNSVKCQSKLTT